MRREMKIIARSGPPMTVIRDSITVFLWKNIIPTTLDEKFTKTRELSREVIIIAQKRRRTSVATL